MSTLPKILKAHLAQLPEGSGVYRFFDLAGEVIYIGKAKSLRKRVRSYFQAKDLGPKNAKLVEKIADVAWVETANETEALVLEANFIREYAPRYNVLLRDDKSYVYVRVDLQNDFPTIRIVRRGEVRQDGARYFGPKISAGEVGKTLRMLRKIFPYSTCQGKKQDGKPCFERQLGLCPGVCTGEISSEKYRENVLAICDFLGGKYQEVLQILDKKIKELATLRKYEQAQAMLLRKQNLARLCERQVVEEATLVARDVVGFVSEGKKHYFNLFLVREGKLIDTVNFILSGEGAQGEILQAFFLQYYAAGSELPDEILLQTEVEESSLMEEYLSTLRGRRVRIVYPQKGDKSRLLTMAERNADAFRIRNMASFTSGDALAELQRVLDLPHLPVRIEGYDISHFGGEATVGAMVVCEKGEMVRASYRNFKIKDLPQGKVDDYASLTEVLRRRMSYLVPQFAGEIRKARKGDLKILNEHRRQELQTTHDWWVAERQGQIVACVQLSPLAKNKAGVLRGLWVAPSERGERLGYTLLRYVLGKGKYARVYLDCLASLSGYYTEFGFVELKSAPEEMLAYRKKYCEEFDLNCEDYRYYVWEKKSVDSSFATVPNLILLDGGKGQLSTVVKNVKFPAATVVIGLAKEQEEIWRVGEKKSVVLPNNSAARLLLQRVRDEAHRFGNEHRKGIQTKTFLHSRLDELTSLGAARKKSLLTHFGSLDKIQIASEGELASVLGPRVAARVWRELHHGQKKLQ